MPFLFLFLAFCSTFLLVYATDGYTEMSYFLFEKFFFLGICPTLLRGLPLFFVTHMLAIFSLIRLLGQDSQLASRIVCIIVSSEVVGGMTGKTQGR